MSERKPKHAKKLLLLRKSSSSGRRWIRVLSLCRYLIAGTSLLALYNVRHHSRLVRWAKRGVGILGAVKMVRKALESC
ncbi:YqjK family protein [Sodalis glossinidius]|uniref:YqjK family protein n=1 Tax=Sodalis glossinidius TaxID=63612 RepID=UPI0014121EDC|nr:YqjK family protein [Sodalis glossinidius]